LTRNGSRLDTSGRYFGRKNVAKKSNKAIKTQTLARAAVFSALSSPLRLQVLELLLGGESNVTKLVQKLNAEQPNVSRHLSVLRGAHLVKVRRNGLERMYRLGGPTVNKLLEAADHFLASDGGGA
jgi:DNA-binding transcriptional ArsR family regulator